MLTNLKPATADLTKTLSSIRPLTPTPLAGIPSSFLRLVRPAALAAVFGAATVAALPANAAECLNGYRTLPNQVIVLCDRELGAARAQFPNTGVVAPLTTGSIQPRGEFGSMVVDDARNCQPGKFWMTVTRVGGPSDPTMPMPCR